MSNGTPMKVPASEVQTGDYLPGLDNGYVIDVEENPDVRDGAYNTRVGGEGFVMVTFNTADGDEAYLLVPDTMPVSVERPEEG